MEVMLSTILRGYNTRIMLTITLLLFRAVIVSGCKDIAFSGTDQTTTLAFQEVDSRGLNPESIPAQKVVFRDQESWEVFWEKYGKETVPKIDFTKDIVVGVFLGPQPNPGYGVEITQIQKSGSQIVVKVVERIENPNFGYIAVIIYPYHIVSFPKVEGEIIFTAEQKVDDRLER